MHVGANNSVKPPRQLDRPGDTPSCKQEESGRGCAPSYPPTHRPPAAGRPRSHRRGAGQSPHGRRAEAGRPMQGFKSHPCRHTRQLALALRGRKSVSCPLSCTGLPPSALIPAARPHPCFIPLRRLLTLPAATPPLQGGREVALTRPCLYPPLPPLGGRGYHPRRINNLSCHFCRFNNICTKCHFVSETLGFLLIRFPFDLHTFQVRYIFAPTIFCLTL